MNRVGDSTHGIEASQDHDDKEEREERREKSAERREKREERRGKGNKTRNKSPPKRPPMVPKQSRQRGAVWCRKGLVPRREEERAQNKTTHGVEATKRRKKK